MTGWVNCGIILSVYEKQSEAKELMHQKRHYNEQKRLFSELYRGISVKNHTDMLIFHTAICAGASQIATDGRRELDVLVATPSLRSGMGNHI